MDRVQASRRGLTTTQIVLIIAGCVMFFFGVAFIALIATMSFKGIQKARETARRMKCAQQMRDLGMALNQYENDNRNYPGYRNMLEMANDESYRDEASGTEGVSWGVPVLPYLDYSNVYQAYRTANSPRESRKVTIDNFICPSDQPLGLSLGATPLAYVVNTGCIDAPGTPGEPNNKNLGIPRDWQANGVFFDHVTGNPKSKLSHGLEKLVPQVRQSSAFIAMRDGQANTILLSENVDHGQYTDVFEPAIGMIWDINAQVTGNAGDAPGAAPPAGTPTKRTYRINNSKGQGAATYTGAPFTEKSTYDFARPSSQHNYGANFVFTDGHVNFLSEELDYFVYCLLMSADGKNVRRPGETKPLDNNMFRIQVDDGWLRQ